MFVIEFGKLQDEIVKHSPENYRTFIYKIYMILVANYIAKKYNIQALVMGNSWGQVSSQTSGNLYMTDVFSELPIISPLLATNKDSIIKTSQKCWLEKLSISDSTSDCCVMHLPKYPIINANKKIIDSVINKIINFMDIVVVHQM